MKNTLPLLLALALLLPTRAQADEAKNLLDTARAAGRFSTLLAALEAAHLTAALAAPGPITVFAPTDEAFAQVPKEALAGLLKPENKSALMRVLTHHVVAGRVLSKDLLPTPSAESLAGTTLAFGLRVGEAHVIAADILCSNGVIHVIDRVLLPPEPTTMQAPKPTSSMTGATMSGAQALDALRTTIDRGAPLYNAGDVAGCAALYEATARRLLAAEGALPEVHGMELVEVVAGQHKDADARAWALRRAFDRVLADAEFQARVEAPLPAGFPAPGPVGRVVMKDYPQYRAARAEGGSGGSFWTLFGHIQRNSVKMTAPVEMTLDDELRSMDMAFLYERPEQGAAGRQGAVAVLDLPPVRVLSVGMRGDRMDADLARAKSALELRLSQDGLKPAGPYRTLGYNSPMVAASQRFWELQVPVAPR